MTYYELSPAYGRDYKSKAEVTAAWIADKDFDGDYQLGFMKVNRTDLNQSGKPYTVNLRYRKLTMVAVVKEKGGRA